MKHLKKVAFLMALVMMLSAFAGCSDNGGNGGTASPSPSASATPSADVSASPSADPSEEPDDSNGGSTAITVVDMLGREITLEEPATRVVALTASDCEILYAIGAGDTLVGRGTYCDYPPEVLDVTTVESGDGMNLEQIIALEPQVLIMSTMAQTEEQIQMLDDAGIKVVVSDAQDIAGVYTAIQLIGDLMGKSSEAEAVIADMQATFDEVAAKVPADGEKKTVYFEVSPLEYGLWAAGANTFMDEIANMLGLENIFADVEGWSQVSEEQVLERDPDYIVTIAMYYGEGATPTEEIAARAGWENVTAVKNGAILNLANNELSRPAPRLADGAEMMSELIYGE